MFRAAFASFALAVFVASSCVGQRPATTPPAPQPRPAPAPAALAPSPPEAPAQRGFASFYARRFAGRRTANGERYDPTQLTAAHRTLPFGTMVEVRRAGGDPKSVVVRVNDRGPYVRDRIIDLSRRAAEQLGMLHDGKALVELRLVDGSPQSSSRP